MNPTSSPSNSPIKTEIDVKEFQQLADKINIKAVKIATEILKEDVASELVPVKLGERQFAYYHKSDYDGVIGTYKELASIKKELTDFYNLVNSTKPHTPQQINSFRTLYYELAEKTKPSAPMFASLYEPLQKIAAAIDNILFESAKSQLTITINSMDDEKSEKEIDLIQYDTTSAPTPKTSRYDAPALLTAKEVEAMNLGDKIKTVRKTLTEISQSKTIPSQESLIKHGIDKASILKLDSDLFHYARSDDPEKTAQIVQNITTFRSLINQLDQKFIQYDPIEAFLAKAIFFEQILKESDGTVISDELLEKYDMDYESLRKYKSELTAYFNELLKNKDPKTKRLTGVCLLIYRVLDRIE